MMLQASLLGLLASHSIIASASFVPPYYEVGYDAASQPPRQCSGHFGVDPDPDPDPRIHASD
jgi:hypothetical protein